LDYEAALATYQQGLKTLPQSAEMKKKAESAEKAMRKRAHDEKKGKKPGAAA